ncbi:MAG: Xaa-Pro peptidase family protein [Candidatus Acidiferrales bacterium]
MDRLRFSFSSIGADTFLVSELPNIRYLCGFTGSAGLLLVETSRATLFTDSRYTFQAQEEVTNAHIEIVRRGLTGAVGSALRKRAGRARVAYSPSHVTVAQHAALRKAAGSRVRWVNGGHAVEKLRALKDPQELATMRQAAVLVSKVFEQALPLIRPGISELDLAAELEYAMKQKGASGPSFETIVASGPRSAWAHAQPSSNPLRKSELVVLDQGAILRGYCSDMTRTVFLGRAPARIRRLYRAVLAAQEAARAAIRPGVSGESVDAAARRVLKGEGLAQYFTHSTGHGLGLEVHEMPRLGKGEKTILEEGMVITVEPGVYIEGLGGIRIEDDMVVTSKGGEALTTATRDFLEL